MLIYIPGTWGKSTDNLRLCIQISRGGESSGGVGGDYNLPGHIRALSIPYNIQWGSKTMGYSICMMIQPTNMSGHGPSCHGGRNSPRQVQVLACIQNNWDTFSNHPRYRICHQIHGVTEYRSIG